MLPFFLIATILLAPRAAAAQAPALDPTRTSRGEKVDVRLNGKWRRATVDNVDDQHFYLIKYDDLGPEWNEWVTAGRMRRRE
jgi:hypothetical protein